MGKVIAFEHLHRLAPRQFVFASGTFDLFHVGHLQYLQTASKMGPLVVGVTEGHFIEKGPGRPVFTNDERLSIIAELECVNWCCLVPYRTMLEAIHTLKPKIYVKGSETRRNGNADLLLEMNACVSHGGETKFIGIVSRYSSGALLHGDYMTKKIEEKPL